MNCVNQTILGHLPLLVVFVSYLWLNYVKHSFVSVFNKDLYPWVWICPLTVPVMFLLRRLLYFCCIYIITFLFLLDQVQRCLHPQPAMLCSLCSVLLIWSFSACECSEIGSFGEECDVNSGQCKCKDKFQGRSCDRCQVFLNSVNF